MVISFQYHNFKCLKKKFGQLQEVSGRKIGINLYKCNSLSHNTAGNTVLPSLSSKLLFYQVCMEVLESHNFDKFCLLFCFLGMLYLSPQQLQVLTFFKKIFTLDNKI